MTITKDNCNQDGTGIRRMMPDPRIVQYTFTDDQQCYTQFFVSGKPPKGLRKPEDPDIRYICQPPEPVQVPEHTYYATMFDESYGIAVFSAYILTKQLVDRGFWQREKLKPDFCPTPGNLLKCYRRMPNRVREPIRFAEIH